ncbi:thioredoxin family protein [Candidatus Acetothermia bacterium]|jgi:glutaredoxin|nr:thioredoxin family protein [Candidatus Acetothermia bacterium]
MKSFKRILVSILFLTAISRYGAMPENQLPLIIFFYAAECPDCDRMKQVLSDILLPHPDILVAYYNIAVRENLSLLKNLAAVFGITPAQLPVIFVGEKVIIGAGRAAELKLNRAVRECIEVDCRSPLEKLRQERHAWREILIVGGLIVLLLFVLLVR